MTSDLRRFAIVTVVTTVSIAVLAVGFGLLIGANLPGPPAPAAPMVVYQLPPGTTITTPKAP